MAEQTRNNSSLVPSFVSIVFLSEFGTEIDKRVFFDNDVIGTKTFTLKTNYTDAGVGN